MLSEVVSLCVRETPSDSESNLRGRSSERLRDALGGWDWTENGDCEEFRAHEV